ncbi:MAG: hypothetical protein ACJAU0_000747 [Flavobacteriales bacterium]|jgi:hypothetical protein
MAFNGLVSCAAILIMANTANPDITNFFIPSYTFSLPKGFIRLENVLLSLRETCTGNNRDSPQFH